ncbi:MAG: hypothetical protein P8173_17300, partial [Gammaproteobacteria bacterium]
MKIDNLTAVIPGLKPDRLANTCRALLFIALAPCLFPQGRTFADEVPLYKDAKAPLEQRVNDLFGRLPQDEKLALLGGTGFTTQPIPRLGLPAMAMADAGQG